MTRRLRAFFCSPAEPLDLAVLRIAVFAWLLALFCRTDFAAYAQLPPQLRVAPPGYAAFFHLIPWGEAWIATVRAVAIAASAAALLGWAARSAALIVCLCALYLLGLPECFGKIDHTHHHFIWLTALLAVSRSGDALSLDALRAARRRRERGAPHAAPAASVAYALPLRFVWLLIGVSYLFPGLAKLYAGPEWVFGDNLKHLMHGFWVERGFIPALRIDRYPVVYHSAAAATVLFEVGFLPALFFPTLRRIAVAGGAAFHVLTHVYLRISFYGLLVCYVAFVDWAALLAATRRVVAAAATPPPPPTPARPPSVAGVVWVGSLLLAAQVACGILAFDSWPFGVYPRFAGIASAQYTALEVVVREPDGVTRQIDTGLRSTMLQRLLRPDAAGQAAQLVALRDFVAAHRVALQPGESLQLFEVTRSSDPDDRDKEPLRRTLLSQLDAAP